MNSMEKNAEYRLSSAERAMFIEQMLNPSSTAYNINMTYEIKGACIEQVKNALVKIMESYEAFRSYYIYKNDTPVRVLTDSIPDIIVKEIASSENVSEYITSYNEPFDLSGIPVKVIIYHTEKDEIFIQLLVHHIMFDGGSFRTFTKLLGDTLCGSEIIAPEYDLSYSGEHINEFAEEHLEYYKKIFEDGVPTNELPVKDIRPDVHPASDSMLTVSFPMDRCILMEEYSKAHSITVFQLLFAASAMTVGQYCGSEDIVLGMAKNIRDVNTANTIGMFVNILPVRTKPVYTKRIDEYLKEVTDSVRGASKNKCCSFESLVKELCSDRDTSHYPIYDVGINLVEGQITYRKGDVEVIASHEQQMIDNDIQLNFEKKSDGMNLYLEYSSELFDSLVIENFANQILAVLKNIISGDATTVAEALEIPNDQMALLDSFNDTSFEYEKVDIVTLFRRQASINPDNICVVYKDKEYTYKQVDAISDRIAAHLISMNIGKEDVVSTLLPRCEYLTIVSLGVLKAGAAYQPLDPSYPSERLEFMISDASAKLVISDEELLSCIPEYKGDVFLLNEIATLPEKADIDVTPGLDDKYILLYTSGSTGIPKGVMLEHRNLIAFCSWYCNYYGLDSSCKVAAYASYGFDANMMDMYPALSCGAQVHIIAEDIRLDLKAIETYFDEKGITHSFMTTQVGRQFAQYCNPKTLKHLSVGGEKLVPLLPEKSFDFYNVYGPTECTILSTTFKVDRDYKRVPIGKPTQNLRLYVVDKYLNRVPLGVSGELLISGHQVGRGYLNRPEKNAESFITNPYTDECGYEKAYRTGDIVRFLPDGCIDFIGRNDGQVKIRGFRIELSEIEEVIRRFDGIEDATVQAFDASAGGKFVAAYIVSNKTINVKELNDFIASQKPPYMVPAVTMQIDRIPLNQNQKVNKKELPVPEYSSDDITPPETESQQKIFDMLADLFGHDSFGIDTEFVYAGLTSIASIQLSVMLSDEFNIPIKISDLKEYNTVKKLDNYIKTYDGNQDSDMEIREYYALTKTQQGIFAECMAHPDSTIYNIPVFYELGEKIDLNRLRKAVVDAVNAHPYCMTRLVSDNGAIRFRRDDSAVFTEDMIGEAELSVDELQEKLVKPYKLLGDCLFRITIVTGACKGLFIDMHHIISDGSSLNIFTQDISLAYLGEAIKKETFSGYEVSLMEEKALLGDGYESAKSYYENMLLDAETDCIPPRTVNGSEESSKVLTYTVDNAAGVIKKYCEENKLSMSTLFNGAFGYVLGKYINKDDVVYCTVYNGRSDSRMNRTISMLVKTFPVRSKIKDNENILSYLMGIGSQMSDSMSNDIYSFADISRNQGISADILFTYQGDMFAFDTLCGEKCNTHTLELDDAKALIDMDVILNNNQISFVTSYRSDIYDESFILSLCKTVLHVATMFTLKTSFKDITLITDEMREKLIGFNDTDYPVPDEPVNKMFERQVTENPSKIAVIAAGETLTYDELNRLANRVAHGLIKRGVTKDEIVGLLCSRTKEAFIGELGIMKSGAAFLPMVPEYPDDRIDFCLGDAGSRYIITTEKIKKEKSLLFGSDKEYEVITFEELLAENESTNPDVIIASDSLVYVIYTSGSTGTPKGVMLEHRNLRNFLDPNEKNPETANYYKYGHMILSVISISFDFSIMETMLPLCNGLSVCMADEKQIHDPVALAELMKEYKVDVMSCTPSFIGNMIDFAFLSEALAGMKLYDFGAEAFPKGLYEKLKKASPDAVICNGYGPTETTISCVSKVLESGESITIGRPAANVKTYVCDADMNILPVGACGELVIAGAGVGRGYVKLPEKTAAAFTYIEGMRAYRSGDVVRVMDNGEIEFFGRMDNQVKLRGFRVELDEIENNINAYPGVNVSKVIVRNNGKEDYLAAFFTADTEIDSTMLTAFLKEKLTYYMVPAVMMQLSEMPLTVNGKIDKKRLPEVEYTVNREYVEPMDGLEREICEIYKDVLSLDKVGATDSFFEIGGTSLTATIVVIRLSDAGHKVVYKNIFDNPTPRELAVYLSGASNKEKVFSDKYDYSEINNILKENVVENADNFEYEDVHNIIITGVTGFLGIHIFKQYLASKNGIVYCLCRKGKYKNNSVLQRLNSMMMYYFGQTLSEEDKTRVVCIDGDITNAEQVEQLKSIDADTVINCAALVKHFVSDDSLDRINVEGVKNLIDVCISSKKRLVQISTTSIGGMMPAARTGEFVSEDKLFFDQIIDNDYIRTKFLAERAILEARATRGLDGYIIRVGNLMSRNSDGEFQINFITNSFMRSLKAFKMLKAFPISMMHEEAEFSPIDSTAEAILKLVGIRSNFSVFHAYNNHVIYMSDVIYAMKHYGFDIEIMSDDRFAEVIKKASKDDKMSDAVLGVIAYDSDSEKPTYPTLAKNRFTEELLYRVGYLWPITDNKYLYNAIYALDGLGFFGIEDENPFIPVV